jgi:hypothetical protein
MLNPSMQYAGFGDVNKSYTMYAIDFSRAEVVDYYAVAYPSGQPSPPIISAQTTPGLFQSTPVFQDPDNISVKVTLSGGGQTYEFSGKNSSFEGNIFNVSTSSYGGSACIHIQAEDKYTRTAVSTRLR